MTAPRLPREAYEPAETDDGLWDDWATSDSAWSRWRKLDRQSAYLDRPIMYELALTRPGMRRPCVVYGGATKSSRDRLNTYFRSGSHIGHLFEAARGLGYTIEYRTRVHASEAAAFVTERRHLMTFDYAWNSTHNGRRRPTEEAVARCNDVRRPPPLQLVHLTAKATLSIIERYNATAAERAAYREGLTHVRPVTPPAAAPAPARPGTPVPTRAARSPPAADDAPGQPKPHEAKAPVVGFPKLTAAQWREYGPARPRVL